MFGFGRRKKIEDRARSVGDLMLLIVSSINSMSLEEFIEANHRRGFVDAEVDLRKGTYSFFECEMDKADFSFSVDYRSSDVPMVTAGGYGDYFGLVLNGFSPGCIGANLIDYHRDQGTLGRDARALQSALLKFPGFSSTDRTWESFGLKP